MTGIDETNRHIMEEGIAGNASFHAMRVHKFMRRAGQETPLHPKEPSEEVRLLRAKLILEEALETIEALGVGVNTIHEFVTGSLRVEHFDFFAEGKPNLVEVADGCADLRVVTTGTLLACGILNDEEIQEAVDESNLAKFEAPKCPECGFSAWGSSNRDKARTCNQCGTTTNTSILGGYKREDGKWIKPANWQAPNLRKIVYKDLYNAPIPPSHPAHPDYKST